MAKTRAQILEWESRVLVPAGIATFLGVVLLVASAFVVANVSGDNDAEVLRSANENGSSVVLSALLQALGFTLLVAPLYVLFRAAAARSDRVRVQLVGLVVAAPLFFAVSSVFNAVATNDAADKFVAGEAKPAITLTEAREECTEELEDVGRPEYVEDYGSGAQGNAKCANVKLEDDAATEALADSSTRGLATGFGLGGRLGLAVALFYSCLWGMRTGLLTRFWGSLGMALGVAALLLLVQFTLLWFIYFGLLLIGRVPGGRPPAWAAGEAIPWPTPGEQAAAKLERDEDAIDVDAEEIDPGHSVNGHGGDGDSLPRKRKKRE